MRTIHKIMATLVMVAMIAGPVYAGQGAVKSSDAQTTVSKSADKSGKSAKRHHGGHRAAKPAATPAAGAEKK